MISRGEFEENSISYNSRIEPSDWRYSAAIVGMIRFFDDREIAYSFKGRYLYYNFEDIHNESNDLEGDKNYLLFAEKWFSDKMHHKELDIRLEQSEFTEEQISEINKILSVNIVVMKEVFKGVKFDGTNKKQIEQLIEDNRLKLIKGIFSNANSGYKKFINNSKYRSESGEVCRLLGFCVDTGRKTKSIGFCFDKESRTFNDEVEFDFIPFAFSQSGSSIFINNNTSIKYLLQSNGEMNYFLKQQFENQKTWNSVFYSYSEGAGFIDYDVEVIVKNMETDYYESMFIRQPAIKIFNNIADNREFSDSLANVFKRHIKVNDNYYINVMQEVTDSILNELSLDDLIERLMKLEYDTESNTPETFCLSRLIYINEIIYKNMEGNMEKTPEFKGSSAAASQVVQYFISNRQENKIKGYQQRLANTLISKDYDRFVEIMLQLSSYTEVPFVFMHKLIQDFEANKNLAYNFINSLIISSKRKDEKGNQEEE
mgnify:FL=1